MKYSLSFLVLCSFCCQPASANDVWWNGQRYTLQTVHPVGFNFAGEVIPLPPMTILVPAPPPDPVPAALETRRTGPSKATVSGEGRKGVTRVAARTSRESDSPGSRIPHLAMPPKILEENARADHAKAKRTFHYTSSVRPQRLHDSRSFVRQTF